MSVQDLVQSIQNHHRVHVEAGIQWSWSRANGHISYWTVTSHRLDAEGQRYHLRSVVREWPNPNHKTVAGMIFGMLYELDEKLAKVVWTQSELPTK